MRGNAFALAGALGVGTLVLSLPSSGQGRPRPPQPDTAAHQAVVQEEPDGTVVAADLSGTFTFRDWSAYFASDFFRRAGMRCGASPRDDTPLLDPGTTADCTNDVTDPKAEYDPSGGLYRIPVVVHVIEHSNGNGYIPDAVVQSQIDILNEDFLALPGTNGAPGTDVQVEFHLATEDPGGNPTNGITRHVNDSWYNDSGNYQQVIHWDTNRYLNLYTNTASGYLGYAYIPNGGGVVGNYWDGCVIHWQAFGRNSPWGPPYDQGRTATHEVGHYLGLFHTFDGGCHAGGCYTNGDLICDTERETGPIWGCPGNPVSCGTPDPYHNYMDYSDDLCMWEFTPEQARRVRCTIENWRPNLYDAGEVLLFSDGFESGDYSGGGWVPRNKKAKVRPAAAWSGSYGARLRKRTDIRKTLNTVGYDDVRVEFVRRSTNYVAGEVLRLQWWNGAAWETVYETNDTAWDQVAVPLPAGAGQNPALELRFRTTSKQLKARSDLDDVKVYGS